MPCPDCEHAAREAAMKVRAELYPFVVEGSSSTQFSLGFVFARIQAQLQQIEHQQRSIMAKIDDQVAQIKTAIADANTAVLAEVDRVAADVTELKNQVANGGAISEADLASILDGLTGIKTTVASVDPLPDFPPAPPAV